MAYIGARPTSNFRVAPVKDSFTGNGSTTAFDLANIVPDCESFKILDSCIRLYFFILIMLKL